MAYYQECSAESTFEIVVDVDVYFLQETSDVDVWKSTSTGVDVSKRRLFLQLPYVNKRRRRSTSTSKRQLRTFLVKTKRRSRRQSQTSTLLVTSTSDVFGSDGQWRNFRSGESAYSYTWVEKIFPKKSTYSYMMVLKFFRFRGERGAPRAPL